MKTTFLLMLINILVASSALAHGEDQQGPHGGEIRMPGAFHTEVVQGKPNSFFVYLLDINWKSPTTRNSTVDASIKNSNTNINLTCIANADHFECKSARQLTSFNNGEELNIKAVRESATGGLAVYKLPLKKHLSKTK
jgi:hypothetical protein